MRWRALGALAAFLVACNGFVNARRVIDLYNTGFLDARSDPAYPADQRARDLVVMKTRNEINDAFFGQGSGQDRVAKWLRDLDPGKAFDCRSEGDASAVAQQTVERSLGVTRRRDEALCERANQPNAPAVEELADFVRFQTVMTRARAQVCALLDEGIVTRQDVLEGGRRAFDETAAYLANRRWRRSLSRPITGLVVRGGSATGIFSAGVVWVALSLIHRCISAQKCDERHGFDLLSGTSTGATIVGAVDHFHTDIMREASREAALARFAEWFLCSGMNDLYCVRERSALNLARQGGDPKNIQDSVIDFTPMAEIIERNYRCEDMNNRSELVLNSVEFRTGRLFNLSDQDRVALKSRWDVTLGIVGSAALPLFVRPTYHLPSDPVLDAGAPYAYLDGGIRSMLPVMSLVRRGVDRVLMISSGASAITETPPIKDGMNMLIRVLEVTTSGATESEIEHAEMRAAASRLSEHEYCTQILADPLHAALCSDAHCDREAMCAGDFRRACARASAPPVETPSHERVVNATWRLLKVWRDERRVEGLHGYAFDPSGQRRLMTAGVEAGRQKCKEIAALLGIENVPDAQLLEWCTQPMPSSCPNDGKAHNVEALACKDDDGPKPLDPTSPRDCK